MNLVLYKGVGINQFISIIYNKNYILVLSKWYSKFVKESIQCEFLIVSIHGRDQRKIRIIAMMSELCSPHK